PQGPSGYNLDRNQIVVRLGLIEGLPSTQNLWSFMADQRRTTIGIPIHSRFDATSIMARAPAGRWRSSYRGRTWTAIRLSRPARASRPAGTDGQRGSRGPPDLAPRNCDRFRWRQSMARSD